MYERYASFDEYVRDYGLQRSEGVLLRYLSDVYKVLVQTVPEAAKDDAVIDVAAFLRAVIRRVDSSLVDEWESLQSGPEKASPGDASADPRAIARERERAEHDALRALAARVRAEMHLFLRALAAKEYEQAVGYVRDGEDVAWTAEALAHAMKAYWEDYDGIRTDLPGRDPKLTVLTPDGEGRWRVRQIVPDPLGDGMYFVEGTVDRAAVHQAKGDPVVALNRIAIV